MFRIFLNWGGGLGGGEGGGQGVGLLFYISLVFSSFTAAWTPGGDWCLQRISHRQDSNSLSLDYHSSSNKYPAGKLKRTDCNISIFLNIVHFCKQYPNPQVHQLVPLALVANLANFGFLQSHVAWDWYLHRQNNIKTDRRTNIPNHRSVHRVR